MIRQYCDRCGHDITNKHSTAVSIVGDADQQGNGAVTKTADLCPACGAALVQWLGPGKAVPPTPKRKRPAGGPR